MADIVLTKSVFERVHLQWFAAEDEGRTEQPTEHKLRKAREEGRIPKSQEIAGALVMLLPIITLIILAPRMLRNFVEMMRYFFDRAVTAQVTDTGIAQGFFYFFIQQVLPILIVAVISAVLANMIQIRGFIFTMKPLEPKFSKIIPNFGNYFKRTLFSFEGAFNIIKSLVKVAVIFIAAWIIVSGDIERLLSLSRVELQTGVTFIAWMAAKLLITAALIFLVIAIPDYVVQRIQFMESMKMKKQEIKEEYKEMEGDPLVKSKIRERIREMMSYNMTSSVASSDVVITNPTHYAIAVKFDNTVMNAPMVTAKGADAMALRIREIARENDVSIVENKPLARALYAEAEIGDTIPEKYLETLAIILGKVYTMRGKIPA
ncbi:MAG: flagellar biosynthesis protein FlhB [Treponemataceae bacterium]|nr:MAG: flagellar biosynthesis protein FlhB [Treponemataceae bacterium]